MYTSQFSKVTLRQVVGMYLQKLEEGMGGSYVQELCTEMPSSSAQELYAGVGTAAPLREWIGGRQKQKLNEGSLTVVNKDFEGTHEVFVKDLRRDKTGQIMAQLGGFAQRAVEHNEILLSNILTNGGSTTLAATYDGKSLFSTTHNFGASGNVSNDITFTVSSAPLVSGTAGTTTAPSSGTMAYAILSGLQSMFGFKDDQGQPTNGGMKKVVVMVPLSFYGATSGALNMEIISQGLSNPILAQYTGTGRNKIEFDFICNPRLTTNYTDKFIMYRTDTDMKPFINQVEVAPEITMIGSGTEWEFTNNSWLLGIKKSGNVACWNYNACIRVQLV